DQFACLEQLDDPTRALLWLFLLGLDANLRSVWSFVRIRNTGELLDLPAKRLLVETLHVTTCALLDRRVDKDLDESPVLLHHRARLVARLCVRGDRGHDHRRAVTRQLRCDPTDSVDVRVSSCFGAA